jgi:hypothetical protein
MLWLVRIAEMAGYILRRRNFSAYGLRALGKVTALNIAGLNYLENQFN